MKTTMLIVALAVAGCDNTMIDLTPCDVQDCASACMDVGGMGACTWSPFGCEACVCLTAEGDTWRLHDTFDQLACGGTP